MYYKAKHLWKQNKEILKKSQSQKCVLTGCVCHQLLYWHQWQKWDISNHMFPAWNCILTPSNIATNPASL